jgi:hypothetical protein
MTTDPFQGCTCRFYPDEETGQQYKVTCHVAPNNETIEQCKSALTDALRFHTSVSPQNAIEGELLMKKIWALVGDMQHTTSTTEQQQITVDFPIIQSFFKKYDIDMVYYSSVIAIPFFSQHTRHLFHRVPGSNANCPISKHRYIDVLPQKRLTSLEETIPDILKTTGALTIKHWNRHDSGIRD